MSVARSQINVWTVIEKFQKLSYARLRCTDGNTRENTYRQALTYIISFGSDEI